MQIDNGEASSVTDIEVYDENGAVESQRTIICVGGHRGLHGMLQRRQNIVANLA